MLNKQVLQSHLWACSFSSALLWRTLLAVKAEMEAEAWAWSGTKCQLETSGHSLLQRGVVTGERTGGWIWTSLREPVQKVAHNEGSEFWWHFCHWYGSEKDRAFNYSGFQLHELLAQCVVKSLYGIGPPGGWAYFQDKILRIDETWIKTAFGEDVLQSILLRRRWSL